MVINHDVRTVAVAVTSDQRSLRGIVMRDVFAAGRDKTVLV
jgi:hypothetical protein